MRIKDDFILQVIDDEYIVVPVGSNSERLRGILRLNATGYLLWKALTEKNINTCEDLASILISKCGADKTKAKRDVDIFLNKLAELGCLD